MMDFIADFTSGIIGGVTFCLSGYFMDTVKVRMQMDPKMTSITYTLKHIIRNEGFMQLYSGIYYPLIFTTTGFSFVFSIYELYRRLRQKEHYTLLDGVENGIIVGVAITYMSNPMELVKCIMQNDTQKKYKNSRQCMRGIYREHGVRGLYRGSLSLLMREVPAYIGQFATYEWIKGFYVTKQNPHLTFMQSLLVGPTAAAISWIVSYPQDIIKTKIQVEPVGTYKNSKYFADGGMIQCAKMIYRSAGWRGFFVAFSPCLLRATFSEGIGITVYENSREFIWSNRGSSLVE